MINIDNYDYFHEPNEADNWIWRINNVVGDWVKEHNKSFWYLVEWESKRQGIMKEETTHENFATILVQECSDALYEDDTVDKIFHSIEKFIYKRHLQNFDKQPDSSNVRKYVNKVSELLTKDVIPQNTTEVYTLEQRMKEYLTTTTANEKYSKICFRPIYNGKTATMSIENYVSQRYLDEKRPTRKVIFECVEEKVTEEKVDMLYGRFGTLSNTKLFIASTHSFSGDVKKEAELHDIGLILVNPQYKINENNFILPRTQWCQHPEEFTWNMMLVGKEEMTVPILAYDNGRIDDSLSYILYKYASCSKNNLFVSAPVLTDSEIEEVALKMVMPTVNHYVSQLKKCGIENNVPTCEIDPYELAGKLGLSVNRGKTGKKLGHIDIGRKNITLSNRMESHKPRDRFCLAHEIGHCILHNRVSKKAEDGVHAIVSSTKKWLEHHANYFASCLLMPAPLIRLLYAIYWRKKYKDRIVKPLIIKEPYYKQPDFQQIVGPISKKMNVSLEAAYIRLKKLGLLICEK